MGTGTVYLTKFPKGLWVRMAKYEGAPCTKLLQDHDSTLLPADTRGLVFIEPRTADPFIFREYTVTRTGFPISHARAITSTACQGRTTRDGVIIDCGRHEARVCHFFLSNDGPGLCCQKGANMADTF